jgi:trk system potassium uptake protein TrkA
MAIDQNMEIIEEIKDKVTYAIRMDSTDERALKSSGIEKVDAAIVSIGTNFEDILLTSVLLLQMDVKKVIARAASKIQETILEKLGIHQVINPELEIAGRVATNLLHDELIDYINLGDDYNIIQIAAPPKLVGRSLQEIDLRIRFNLNLITIKRNYTITEESTGEKITKQRIYGVPTASTVIEDGDILVVLGKVKDIKKLID